MRFVTVLSPYLVAFLLGISLTFAFAPYGLFPLAVLSTAGLLMLWIRNENSLKRSFWLGYCFGLGLFGAGVYWVFTSVHVFGGIPIPFAILITLWLIAYLALYPAVTGFLLNRYFPVYTSEKLIYAFPAIWVFSEWVREWLLTGFPWLFLGYSQTNSPLKGYAPLLSVYIISLLVAMSAGLIVNAFIRYRQQALSSCYWNMFVLASIWILGGLLNFIPWTKPINDPISVALVQGNIPQSVKWSPQQVQLSLDRYSELTQSLWGKYKIIIWPESSIPLPMQMAESFIDDLDRQGKGSGSTLILGIPIEGDRGYYNTVVTLGQGKNQLYQKRHLVPFGEYVPFARFLSDAFNFMNIPKAESLAGKNDQSPFVIDDINILPSICYEITFPGLIRYGAQSSNILLVVTNDAWFGHSNAQPQHLQMAAMRALELGKPVLFVSNDGITAIINPDGRVKTALPQRQAKVLTGNVQPMHGSTPWVSHGGMPFFLILFFLLFMATRANKIADKQVAIETINTQ